MNFTDEDMSQWTEIELDDMKKKNSLGSNKRKISTLSSASKGKSGESKSEGQNIPRRPLKILIAASVISAVLTILIVPSVFSASGDGDTDKVAEGTSSPQPDQTEADIITTLLGLSSTLRTTYPTSRPTTAGAISSTGRQTTLTKLLTGTSPTAITSYPTSQTAIFSTEQQTTMATSTAGLPTTPGTIIPTEQMATRTTLLSGLPTTSRTTVATEQMTTTTTTTTTTTLLTDLMTVLQTDAATTTEKRTTPTPTDSATTR